MDFIELLFRVGTGQVKRPGSVTVESDRGYSDVPVFSLDFLSGLTEEELSRGVYLDDSVLENSVFPGCSEGIVSAAKRHLVNAGVLERREDGSYFVPVTAYDMEYHARLNGGVVK